MAIEHVEPIDAELSGTTVPVASSAVSTRVFYGWRIVAAAFVASFTTAGVQAYVAGAFFVPMSDDLGWTRAQFLYGQTFGQFFMAFVGFFIGTYVDRWGARPIMFAGATILAISLALTSGITELWQWILLRGMVTMLGAALLGNLVVNVTISKWFVERRGQAIGLASMGVSSAGILLPALMTVTIDHLGWRVGWRLLAVFVLLLGYPAAFVMRRSPEDLGLYPDGKSADEIAAGGGAAAIADFENSFTRGEALRTKTLYLLVLAFGLGSLGLITMIVITIPYLTDSGFGRGLAALMVSVMAIPSALTKPLWGYLGDRFSERFITALSFTVNAVALSVIILASAAHATVLLVGGYLLVGSGIGGQIPLQESIWASYFGRRHIGAVRSAAMPFTLLFSASGPLLVATWSDRVGSYDGALYGVAAGWALAAVVVLFVRRPTHRSSA
jgi:MFS family permease